MDIQQRIDELMKQNNIDTYITLLRKIFKCSVRDESKTDVQWATNQKSNFTNMLKGKRPFTVEMILGLEHVLHTSMDSIINDLKKYLLRIDKERERNEIFIIRYRMLRRSTYLRIRVCSGR